MARVPGLSRERLMPVPALSNTANLLRWGAHHALVGPFRSLANGSRTRPRTSRSAALRSGSLTDQRRNLVPLDLPH
jgi:hypothetical protein